MPVGTSGCSPLGAKRRAGGGGPTVIALILAQCVAVGSGEWPRSLFNDSDGESSNGPQLLGPTP